MELLGKLREQRVYENRRTFERASDNPNAFSQLQMQSYLKTCKFKRKVASVIVRRPCLREPPPPPPFVLHVRSSGAHSCSHSPCSIPHTMHFSCPWTDALLRE